VRGTILSVCISAEKGTFKDAIPAGFLKKDFGLEGDAHAGTERPVSLLCRESVLRYEGGAFEVRPGIFAENFVVEGIHIEDVRVGQTFEMASGAELEVVRIGKPFHTDNAIFRLLGESPLPKEGIFARVVKSGPVKPGDAVTVSPVRKS